MHVSDWLKQAHKQLSNVGIITARLDCLVLLEDELRKDRAWLLSHSEHVLQGSEIEKLNTKIAQRALHVPLAYIRGHAEFYGRDFSVNEHTLVPRPETESMIELFKAITEPTQNDAKMTVIDIGTGSGAIAVTAKLEVPEVQVIAIDIDEKCLQTARQNAQRLGADITFLHGNLLEPLTGIRHPVFDSSVLLCNLPYVPDNFQINTAATHEPRHALFGGPDGLDLYREMFAQITTNDWKPAFVLTEALPPQHETLATIAKAAGFHLRKTDGLVQMFSA